MSLPRRAWLALGLLGLAILLFVLIGGWMMAQPGGVRGTLVRWFGPPQVELTEAYAPGDGGMDFDHSTFDALLASFVDTDGFVDYEGLAVRRGELERYLESLGATAFDELGRDAKLALLINAYNAFTLELILDHYPLESIRDIPAAERWKAVRFEIGGRLFSLDQIEHEQIRPMFTEPRIHFALVCAAVSCPPLRREAYMAARLNEQLEAQAEIVHHGERWIRYVPGSGKIALTPLYEWFRGDFDQVAGSILDFAARYRGDLATELATGDRPDVRFLDYDWSLNRQPASRQPASGSTTNPVSE